GTDPGYVGIERVAVTSNAANKLGGGLSIQTPGTIRDSVISNNTSNQTGGGGLHYAFDARRYLDVSGSTFVGHSTTAGSGGAVYTTGVLRLTNSTISANHGITFSGGIYVDQGGALVMTSSTVVFNSGSTNPFFTLGSGGVTLNSGASGGANSILDSIIAYNTVANPNVPPDCSIGTANAVLTSSYNLVQSPSSCSFTGVGDVTGVDPRVSPALADNGGATPTHALLSGSPALDSGDPSGCNDTFDNALATDQRGAGFPRAVGAACDKGALESPTVTPPGAPAMSAASDSGSSDSDGITNIPTPAFAGTCDNGTQVQVQVDAADVAPSVTCSGGSYAI